MPNEYNVSIYKYIYTSYYYIKSKINLTQIVREEIETEFDLKLGFVGM